MWKTVFVPVKVVINIRVISDDLQFGGEPGRELRARSVPAVSATPVRAVAGPVTLNMVRNVIYKQVPTEITPRRVLSLLCWPEAEMLTNYYPVLS